MSYPVLKLIFQWLKFKQLFCLISFPIMHQQSKFLFQCPGVSYSKLQCVGKGFGSIAAKPRLTKWVGLGQDDDSPCGCVHVVWVFTNSVPASSAAALTQQWEQSSRNVPSPRGQRGTEIKKCRVLRTHIIAGFWLSFLHLCCILDGILCWTPLFFPSALEHSLSCVDGFVWNRLTWSIRWGLRELLQRFQIILCPSSPFKIV